MAEKKRTGVREPRFSVEPCAAFKRNQEYPILPAPDGAPRAAQRYQWAISQ